MIHLYAIFRISSSNGVENEFSCLPCLIQDGVFGEIW